MHWPIFISYRRGPTASVAVSLWRSLTQRFGAAFLDVESIAGGEVFRAKIEFALSSCDVIVVLIGEEWAPPRLSISPPYGDDFDFVQHEVSSALRRQINIVPILVDDAQLPAKNQLPNDIRDLLAYQALALRSDHLDEDLRLIIDRLAKIPALNCGTAKKSWDAQYVSRMSKVLNPTVALDQLAKNVTNQLAATTNRADEGTPPIDPEAKLQALNSIAKAGATKAEILDALLDVADAHFSRGDYVSVNAKLKVANDDINTAFLEAAENPRLHGLEVEIVVGADDVQPEPWMIEARQRATLAVPRFQGSGMIEAIARFHTLAGNYYSSLGEIDDARKYFYEAMQHYNVLADIDGMAISLLNLGHCEDKSGHYDAAEGNFRRALRWAEAIDALPHVAKISSNLGTLYKRRGRYDDAQQILTDAMELAERLGATSLIAESGRELALVYFEMGDMKEAEARHRRVLDIERERDNLDGVARQLHNLASVHAERNEYSVAEGMYREALKINRTIGRKEGIALQLTNLGAVMLRSDRLEEARDVLREALTLNEELQQPMRIAETCLNLGAVLKDLGESEAALDLLQRAADLCKDGPYRVRAEALVSMAGVHESSGDIDSAIFAYESAVPLLMRLGEEKRSGGVLVTAGLLADQVDRHDDMLSWFEAAREIFERHGMPEAQSLEDALRDIRQRLSKN